MTKRRDPLSYHATIAVIADRIGWDGCAAVCGVSQRMVRYWSDPDCTTQIRMVDAERLDRAYIEHGGDHAPFLRLFTQRHSVLARDAKGDLVALACELAKESGEALAATIAASAHSDCPKHLQRAREELQEAMDKMADCLAVLGGGNA